MNAQTIAAFEKVATHFKLGRAPIYFDRLVCDIQICTDNGFTMDSADFNAAVLTTFDHSTSYVQVLYCYVDEDGNVFANYSTITDEAMESLARHIP